MKKNIVFLVDRYYPYASANGNCAGKLAEEFVLRDYQVYVLCQKNSYSIPIKEVIRGCSVIRITTMYNEKYLKSKKIKSKGGLNGVIGSFCLYILRVEKWMRVVLGNTSCDSSWRKSYYDTLCSLNLEDDNTILIPLCYSMEETLAAADYHSHHPKCKLLPWLLDLYATSSTLHRTSWNRQLKYKRHVEQEQYVISQSEKLLFLSSWKDHLNFLTKGNNSMCHEIGLPLATLSDEPIVKEKKELTELVYLGSLLINERNPEAALRVFAHYAELYNDFCFNIYHQGNCDKIINDYASRCPENIVNKGSVSNEKASEARNAADVLVLIGNKHSVQVPSKTFEYLSTKKPIVFFVKDLNDPILPLIEQYGNCFIVFEHDADKVDYTKLHLFLKNGLQTNGDVESLLRKNTPQYIADYITNLINS